MTDAYHEFWRCLSDLCECRQLRMDALLARAREDALRLDADLMRLAAQEDAQR